MNTMSMKSDDILLHDDNNLPWLKSQLRAVTDEDNNNKQQQQQDCFADCGGVLPTNLFAEEEEEEEDSNDDDGDNNKTKITDNNHITSSLSTAMVAIISPGNSRTGTARINKNDNATTDRMLWRRSSSNSLLNIPTSTTIHNTQNQNHLRFTCPTSITSPITTRPTTTATALVVPPTTPRGLFASFSGTQTSSEMNNMWQYDATVSPRTTDAVQMMATSSAAAAVWTSSPSLPLSQQQQENRNMSATMMIPLVPSLVHHGCGGGAVVVANANANANAATTTRSRTTTIATNDIPSIVSVPVVSSFYESFFDNDEDDVSLLADNPDEDDDNVLPIVTYDVLHNTGIFAEDEEQEDE